MRGATGVTLSKTASDAPDTALHIAWDDVIPLLRLLSAAKHEHYCELEAKKRASAPPVGDMFQIVDAGTLLISAASHE
jgi:hypothetical protein